MVVWLTLKCGFKVMDNRMHRIYRVVFTVEGGRRYPARKSSVRNEGTFLDAWVDRPAAAHWARSLL